MRLLLDEHYSPEIARQLRIRGHDVLAVAERVDLVGLSDDELFQRMTLDRRTIMTNNVKDFLPIVTGLSLRAEDHWSLLLTSDKGMPRRSDGMGHFVDALDALLRRHPSHDSHRNTIRWLTGQ